MSDKTDVIVTSYKPDIIIEKLLEYQIRLLPRIQAADNSKKNSKSPLRFDPNFAITAKFKQILRMWRTMADEQALLLDEKTLYQLYTEFLEVITEINIDFSYAPTKVEFCAYCCISVEAYNRLLSEGSVSVRRQMADIDADLIDSLERSSEIGINTRFTEVRLTSKGTGHSLKKVTPLEDAMDTIRDSMVGYELEKKLAGILSPEQKRLNNDNKSVDK